MAKSAETSERVSSIAARLSKITKNQITRACVASDESLADLVRDIRSVATSALRQDETPRLGGLLGRMFGKP